MGDTYGLRPREMLDMTFPKGFRVARGVGGVGLRVSVQLPHLLRSEKWADGLRFAGNPSLHSVDGNMNRCRVQAEPSYRCTRQHS